jgi:uncharacterized cupredoxin-like copper-binding protein
MRSISLRRLFIGAAVTGVLVISGACASAGAAPSWSFHAASPGASAAAPVTPTVAPSIAATLDPVALAFTPGTVAAPRVINVTGDDKLNFLPGAITVARGETVTFRIRNVGKAEHEFMVGPMAAAFGDKGGTSEIAGIKAGKTGSLTVTFNKPGQYAFACHMPGHYEHGMLGFILVVEPGVPAMGTVANPRDIALSMSDDLMFMPMAIQVRPGETIRFILTNNGTVVHEFQVGLATQVAADKADGVIVVEKNQLGAGSTHEVVFTFNGSGPVAFACHEPGHYEAGMKGTIEVLNP